MPSEMGGCTTCCNRLRPLILCFEISSLPGHDDCYKSEVFPSYLSAVLSLHFFRVLRLKPLENPGGKPRIFVIRVLQGCDLFMHHIARIPGGVP